MVSRVLHTYYTSHNDQSDKPVFATYMLTGTRRAPAATHDGEDTPMISPPLNTQNTAEQRTVLVVGEDKLDEARDSFDVLTSVAMYSIQPAKPSDLNVIAAASQELLGQFIKEDKASKAPTYGTIINSQAKVCADNSLLH